MENYIKRGGDYIKNDKKNCAGKPKIYQNCNERTFEKLE